MSENKAGGNFIYRSSKSALNSIIVGLASEFRDKGIICVVIIPGMTQTDMGGGCGSQNSKSFGSRYEVGDISFNNEKSWYVSKF